MIRWDSIYSESSFFSGFQSRETFGLRAPFQKCRSSRAPNNTPSALVFLAAVLCLVTQARHRTAARETTSGPADNNKITLRDPELTNRALNSRKARDTISLALISKPVSFRENGHCVLNNNSYKELISLIVGCYYLNWKHCELMGI